MLLRRLGLLAAAVAWGLSAAAWSAADDLVIGDFEGEDFGAWEATGDAFGSGPAAGEVDGQQQVTGKQGARFANSFHGGDAAVGELTSPPFTIERGYVSLLIGGGNHEGLVGAELLVDGRTVRTTMGSDTEELLWQNWDVHGLRGKRARVRIVDRVTEGWGHVLADQVVQTDTPKSSYDQQRLDAYRASPGYYREDYRPQFHFTPELNWMNDPNGLVHHDGEHHLFYQHNPFGNAWGHMSWGHAVSRDLVHWEHLPIAIPEEHGVMIFSGCAVVDHENTSGFGEDDEPPIVAIYSSHQRGKQAQCLAFSNDRGRTFTKYAGNPVLDLGIQDFRDPKVFWHEPTEKWVMVVSKAVEKVLQFYGSADLKRWELLSEFGPAGAPGKPNWECPDLFELPIEDAAGEPTGETRWVLEVDMGDGSVAGGSGGEYFVGTFDGKRFACDDRANPFGWVDYGRDFYAPVSWSDLPDEDGRRIWIGWMNNWETHLLPTSPWRSAMSIPRTLSLRETSEGLRLVQRPIRELERLRQSRLNIAEGSLRTPVAVVIEPAAQQLELLLKVAIDRGSGAGAFRIAVLVGDDEETVIGYDEAAQELFIDRTRSGVTDFHEAFPGVHRAPLRLDGEDLELRVFVDASSVEVFAQDGLVALTERVFPNPTSRNVRIGGDGALLKACEGWTLRSIWNRD